MPQQHTPQPHHLTIIARERPFDEERWKQLLTAFAYVLHDQHQAEAAAAEAARPESPVDANTGTDRDGGTHV